MCKVYLSYRASTVMFSDNVLVPLAPGIHAVVSVLRLQGASNGILAPSHPGNQPRILPQLVAVREELSTFLLPSAFPFQPNYYPQVIGLSASLIQWTVHA